MAVGISIPVGKNVFVFSKDGVVHVPIYPGYKPVVAEELTGTAGEPHKSTDKTNLVFEQRPSAFLVVVVRDDKWKEMRVIKPTLGIIFESMARVDIQARPLLWKLAKGAKDIDLDKMGEDFNSAADQVVETVDRWFTKLDKKINDLMAEPPAPPKSGPAAASKPQAPASPAAPAARKPKSGAKSGSRRTRRR